MQIKKKHIIHIITGLDDGGAEGVLYRLCCSDTSAVHTVISMMSTGKYGPLLIEAGVDVVSLNMPRGRVTLGGVFELWRILRRLKPDIVQTWLYHADLVGGVVARLAGIRQVFWGVRHNNLTPGTVKRNTILVASICAKLSKIVPYKIISCSQSAVYSHVAFGYDLKRFLVIPNGYDLKLFSNQFEAGRVLRNALGISENITLLGMVGRFDPQKDLRNLLGALGALRSEADIMCLLVGAGMEDSNTELTQWISDSGCRYRICLLGKRTDIPAIMSALDIHVLSSLGEGFPNVLAEAMASGTPCVTTNVGDAALIVGNTGWIVPPQDSVALSDAIKEAVWARMNGSEWERRCVVAQQRIVENFGIKKMVTSYHEAWDS